MEELGDVIKLFQTTLAWAKVFDAGEMLKTKVMVSQISVYMIVSASENVTFDVKKHAEGEPLHVKLL